MNKTLMLLVSALALAGASASEKDTRCYELRVYYAAPGKLDDLNTRFRDHTMKLFEKHGMVNVGYWVPLENTDNKLIYLLSFPTREAREKAWKEFNSDPDWKAAQKASEVNGRLVTNVVSTLMTATDYSPPINASAAPEPRIFELRTYSAAPGHLEDLNARFRDHTVALFQKHGMTSFGYWTPMKGQKGADDTLIYILIHQSRESAATSFKAFLEDSDWIKARKVSEEKAGGPLTVKDGVQSVFIKPTDYSPTK